MPSHTVALTDAQYQYILATKEESVSQRVRELVEKGMEAEENE
jgi:predicted CopG family antitoxin